ncbi:MAG TPA: rubrerythrin family protein [Candidatus Cloacimonadota bacterium]|nr:rubrerythrin family protein [Candidatus Cloacimonadota bacterium]HPT72213.1 rubrerythrin family protein [Candidatus Cloacimonadota bacterium]
MPDLKGTRTAENLMKAFAGESQARNRYTYAARTAQKEGFEHIAGIFLETADNERVHAKLFLSKLIEHGMSGEGIEITAAYPVFWNMESTVKNLEYAVTGENEEWSYLYPLFADIAEEEGFKDVAVLFRMVAKVEVKHEARYKKLLHNVLNHEVFKKDGKVYWRCRECGYIHEGTEAPMTCPVCAHPQAFYEMFVENY